MSEQIRIQPQSAHVAGCARQCNLLILKDNSRGGDERDRTADLYTASVALSQLSYVPMG